MHYAKTTISVLAISLMWSIVYATYSQETLEERVERENRETLLRCLDEASTKSTSEEILQAKNACSESILTKIIVPTSTWSNVSKDTTTGSVIPVAKRLECKIGTGSHDVRHLSDKYPWVAGWKNNNVSGITLGSKALEKAFWDAGIKWYVWTPRPSNEWSNYYWFPDLENWLRAKLLIIKRSYQNATIASYLKIWWTDSISIPFDKKRLIASLSDDELLILTKRQIQKESWKAMSDYIFKNIITCN